MNTIILFTPKNVWHPSDWAKSNGQYTQNENQITAETSTYWISIIQDNEVIKDYEPDELEQIRMALPDYTLFVIEWRGHSLLEKFIENFPEDQAALIDNDYGLICPHAKLKGLRVSQWLTNNRL